jgi:type I restriction enzyme S subunit
MKYPEIKLGEVADIKGGKRLPKGDLLVEFDTGFPYIRAQDIKNGLITFKEPKFITSDLRQKLKNYTVNKHDVCITIVGAYVGDVGIVPNHLSGANLTENAVKLTNLKNNFNSQYLKYALLSREAQEAMKKFGSGAAQDKLGIYKIKEIQIPNPPPEIQRKIAGILSAYDRLIENNTRRIEILEEMARSLYREWFVNFRFPGHEQAQMVDSELGLIPEGWEPVKLGDIAQDIRRSINPDLINPETPYFGLEHLPRKSIALSEWGTASQVQSTKLVFHKGEILFGKIRPYFHKVGVAPVEGVCSSDAIVIKTKNTDYFPIVLACVSSEEFVAHATQTSQGTKMPRANWDVLIKYPVVIPPPPLLYQFNELVQNTLAQIHNLIFKNRNLRKTRDLLLPRLISGEIDVENLDINTGELANPI